MAEAIITPVRDQTAAEPGPITADMGMIVARAARRFGAKTALVADGRTLTYQELDDLCDRVAGGLYDIGVRPGDRVSLYSPNRWEWVVAYHAALRAGAVVNPINVMLTAEEVAFVLNDCGAAAIFASGEKAAVIAGLTRGSGSVPTLRRVISFDPAGGGVTSFEELLSHPAAAPDVPRPAPTDLSTIGYTSGTTGHPKGAMQSHRAVFLNTAAVFAVQTRTDRDVTSVTHVRTLNIRPAAVSLSWAQIRDRALLTSGPPGGYMAVPMALGGGIMSAAIFTPVRDQTAADARPDGEPG